jgi:hypothetical protein
MLQCAKCGSENREESNYCRYCSAPLRQPADPNSGYIPSVPPVGTANFPGGNMPPQNFQQAPPLPAHAHKVVGQLTCPRCQSVNVIKGSIPLWATLMAVIGFFLVCIFSLFFLLVKEPNRCLNCGLEFK